MYGVVKCATLSLPLLFEFDRFQYISFTNLSLLRSK